MSACLWLLLAAVHQSEAMLTALSVSQRYRRMSAATVTLVHAYNDILSTISRTAGDIALLLCAECSAEQAPILGTDF